MWKKNPVQSKTQTSFAFKLHMNDVHLEVFNNQTFNQDGNGSAILKIDYYNALDSLFQHLPIEEKVVKIEVNRIRNGYFVDILTSVDIRELLKNRGKVVRTYEGVLREVFKRSPFKKVIEKMFA